jgi:hypothetical protein
VIAKVLEPRSHGGCAVLFGRYVLHYPAAGDMTFFERMAEQADGNVHMTTCRVEGWPTEPRFDCRTLRSLNEVRIQKGRRTPWTPLRNF